MADGGDWRDYLRVREVEDARVPAGELFRRAFGVDIPDYPRHFVLDYLEGDALAPQAAATPPRVVAYVHFMPYKEVYLGGGMCADERAYRAFPKWLFGEVRREGGLATIVTREAIGLLGDSPAAFGHVGESRARQADLRTGFVDTGLPHLMVFWRKPLDDAEKRRLIDLAHAHGPF